MCSGISICVDAKYQTRSPRFSLLVYPCITSMANPRSGGQNYAWIAEVYAI